MRTRHIAALAATAALLIPAAFLGGGVATASTAPPQAAIRHCTTVSIPVSLSPGGPATDHVAAEYCLPYGWHPDTVDVLVPGATYDHVYWDWPVDPALYNYTDKTLAAGRAVIDVDRIGSGSSSLPPSSEVTLAADAWTLHQVISWARSVAGFTRVDMIGHSLGSLVAAADAATWPADPTRLVLTGYLHLQADPAHASSFFQDAGPASSDPVLAGGPLGSLDPGYLTTLPGTRGDLFYYDPDPRVVAYDEAHKDVVAAGEIPEALTWSASSGTAAITAPVLLVDGQQDWIFCEGAGAANCSSSAAVLQAEKPYYAAATSLNAVVVPSTGHDVALARTADLSFTEINAWLLAR